MVDIILHDAGSLTFIDYYYEHTPIASSGGPLIMAHTEYFDENQMPKSLPAPLTARDIFFSIIATAYN